MQQIRPDILLIILGLVAALAIPSLVYHKTAFKVALTAQERELEKFNPVSLTITKKSWQDRQLSLPVTLEQATAPSMPTPQKILGSTAPQPLAVPADSIKPRITLIISDGAGSGRAVLDGIPVSRGSRIREWTVERIETNRVLLKGRKGSIWVSQD